MDDISVPVDGGHINVWHREPEDGQPTLALIHGLTGTSRWWVPVISHLPAGMGLLAIDARGRGASWDAPGPFDLVTMSDDIRRSLDYVSQHEAIVVGYSMGGWIAAAFASRNPGRTERLVLVDGGLPIHVADGVQPEEAARQAVGPSLARLEMTFESIDAYFEFWRRHPAMTETWHPRLEEVFAYELTAGDNGYHVRCNGEAVIEGAIGFYIDPVVNDAHRKVTAPSTLITVDHGLMAEPGGFMSRGAARQATGANPAISELHLTDLNHYTLMLGAGAEKVANAISVGT